MDFLRHTVADAAAAVAGHPTTNDPPTLRRTIISHRTFADAEDDFSDPPDAFVPVKSAHSSALKPNGASTNGHSHGHGNTDNGMIYAADAVFQRAASATPAPAKTALTALEPAEHREGASNDILPESPLAKESRTNPNGQPATVKRTPKSTKAAKAAKEPKPAKKQKITIKARELKSKAPKAPKATKATKAPKATKATKAPKATKATKAVVPAKNKTTYAGETGLDTSTTVNGETQWEIQDIVGQEGDVLLIKWKGWKGIWEERFEDIRESAPELVKGWEERLSGVGKEVASKGKGRGAAGAKGNGKGGSKTAAGAAAGAKAKGKPGRKPKEEKAKVGPRKTPIPARKTTAEKSEAVNKNTKRTITAIAKTPKKTTAAAAAAVATPKSPAKSPAKRSTPATKSPAKPPKKTAPTAKAAAIPRPAARRAVEEIKSKSKTAGKAAKRGATTKMSETAGVKKRGRPVGKK